MQPSTIDRTMADDILAIFTPFETAVREIDQLRKENREPVNALKEISKTEQARASLATKGR